MNPSRVDFAVDLTYGLMIFLAIGLILLAGTDVGIAFGLGVLVSYVIHIAWKMARFDPEWMTTELAEEVEDRVTEELERTVEDTVGDEVESAVGETVSQEVDEMAEEVGETVTKQVTENLEETVSEEIDEVIEGQDESTGGDTG